MTTLITDAQGSQIEIENCQRVDVIHTDLHIEGEDGPNSLNFTHTKEGLITDLYVTQESETELNYNLGTSSETTTETVERLDPRK